MYKYLSLLAAFLLLGLTNCKSTKLPPASYKSDQIIFGSGGGFAGAYNEYILLDDGRMFISGKNVTEPTEVKVLNKNLTKQIFSTIETFGLDKLQYQQPQNLYEFVNVVHNGNTNRIVWSGKPGSQIAPVHSLYSLLISQVKNKQ